MELLAGYSALQIAVAVLATLASAFVRGLAVTATETGKSFGTLKHVLGAPDFSDRCILNQFCRRAGLRERLVA